MVWNYRKRIKIFPGVHLNFSKSGVSTSIGPKGAKVTFGKKGTYLNTSVPGTGLYSRKKISNKKEDNYDNSSTSHINETHPNKEGFFKIKNTWGCCFRWLGLISIVILTINLFLLVIGSFDYSENNLNALKFYGIIATIFIIVYFRRFMSFLRGKHENESNKMPLTDIDEKTKNDSIERTREMLTKISNQNDSK